MVFRRLKQLVLEFDTFTLNQGQTLGMDPVLLAVRLVGRWQSGAPVALTPPRTTARWGPTISVTTTSTSLTIRLSGAARSVRISGRQTRVGI
jgi:hypothetical protein